MKKLLGLALVMSFGWLLMMTTGCPAPAAPVTVSVPRSAARSAESSVADEIHIHVVKWSSHDGDSNGRRMQAALAAWFQAHPDLELVEMTSDNPSGELVLVAVRR